MEQRPHQVENDKEQSRLKSGVKREIGPDSDIRNGVYFTPLLEPLRTLSFDRMIEPEKVLFILIMIGNSPEFHIRRSYLVKRFSEKTIRKYQKVLTEDNVLGIEKVRLKNGRTGNAYHVNSARLWTLREGETHAQTTKRLGKSNRPASSVPAVSVPAVSVPAVSVPAVSVPGLNETNPNQINSNETKRTLRGGSGYPQTTTEPEKRASKWSLVGRIAALYDGKAMRVIFEGLVDQLQSLFKDQDIIALIEHYENLTATKGTELSWKAGHTARWKKQIAEGYAFENSTNSPAPSAPDFGEEAGYA